jgi:hypothetical protein
MPYYAQIDRDGIAYAVSELAGEVVADNLIPLSSLDLSVLGMQRVGEAWESVQDNSTPTISSLTFLRRFTAPERVAIRSSHDPYVADFLDLLNKATEISNADPDVQGGMAYLVSLGLLTQERARDVLGW